MYFPQEVLLYFPLITLNINILLYYYKLSFCVLSSCTLLGVHMNYKMIMYILSYRHNLYFPCMFKLLDPFCSFLQEPFCTFLVINKRIKDMCLISLIRWNVILQWIYIQSTEISLVPAKKRNEYQNIQFSIIVITKLGFSFLLSIKLSL